jgi:DNA-binding response OmpR family regulator
LARILLIDDDPDFRADLRAALSENDHLVDCLDSAESCAKSSVLRLRPGVAPVSVAVLHVPPSQDMGHTGWR